MVLDDRELEELKIHHPEITSEEAQDSALLCALIWTTSGINSSTWAAAFILPPTACARQIDIVSSSLSTATRGTVTRFRSGDAIVGTPLNVDLPFERTAQRNNYRAAIINQEQAGRQLQQREDEIKLQVRNDWRNLEQARRNFESSEIGVELSERRVQEQELRAQVGRGTARDLVDAQNDLIAQKNLAPVPRRAYHRPASVLE